jgi:ATP-binding cassette subfamily B protein
MGMPDAEAKILSGKIISFILLINLISRPLRVIADKFNVLQMGMVSSERVFKVIDNDDYLKTDADYAPREFAGKIQFKKVWFAYIDNRYVLKDISFTVEAGSTIALVGHTGSGKTSIISLMNRLYHIQKGEICVDDININNIKLDVLRSKVGVVLQDVFLFSGSVLDNITLRNPGISRENVIEAAKMIIM